MKFLTKKSFYICIFCLIFIFLNSKKLVQSRNKVIFDTNYVKFNRTYPYFSACLEINSKFFKCSRLNATIFRREFNVCVKLMRLYAFIEYFSTVKTPKSLLERLSKIKIKDLIQTAHYNEFRFDKYFFNFNHVCLRYKCIKCDLTKKLTIFNTFSLSYTLFIHDESYPFDFNRYLVKQLCKPFKYCDVQTLNLERYDFNLLPAPYITNCLNFRNLKFHFQANSSIKTQLEVNFADFKIAKVLSFQKLQFLFFFFVVYQRMLEERQ